MLHYPNNLIFSSKKSIIQQKATTLREITFFSGKISYIVVKILLISGFKMFPENVKILWI